MKYKYLGFLQMLYITLLLLGTCFAYKIVQLGPFIQPGSSVIYPISYLLGDVIAETYGYKIARQLIWNSILCGYIFAFLAYFIIHLPFPAFFDRQQSYEMLFGNILRFSTAGTLGLVAGAFTNAYAISKWKILMKGKHFWLRSLGASSLGELVHILISIPLAFYHTVPDAALLNIIFSVYGFRLCYNLLAVWPATAIVVILKQKEGVDMYDTATDFTPFRLRLTDEIKKRRKKKSRLHVILSHK